MSLDKPPAHRNWGWATEPKSLHWAYFGIFTAWQQLEVWNWGGANLVPLIATVRSIPMSLKPTHGGKL